MRQDDPPRLTWPARPAVAEPPAARLIAEAARAVGRGPAGVRGNRLIAGDCLPALRALEGELAGKVRCVYLDPPYNTGTTFSKFDDGVQHGAWLDFMRDRLLALRPLLSDDGSLWASCDDHEGHYLKVLCDEVFGRSNFVATCVWQKKYTRANDARHFSANHDFILVYARHLPSLRLGRLPRTARQDAAYRNPDADPRGPWKSTPLHAKSGSVEGAAFEHVFANGRRWRPPAGTFPRFTAASLARLEASGTIWFGRSGSAVPTRKTYLADTASDGITPLTIWGHDEVGHNHEAREEAKRFARGDPFPTPKPERLLARVLQLATVEGDLVLDPFLGSGTTAAVAHKLGRRWIGIESGEHLVTHCLPRLRAVVDGSDEGGVSAAAAWRGGGAFRYYRVV